VAAMWLSTREHLTMGTIVAIAYSAVAEPFSDLNISSPLYVCLFSVTPQHRDG
jgi:hypothetical protein